MEKLEAYKLILECPNNIGKLDKKLIDDTIAEHLLSRDPGYLEYLPKRYFTIENCERAYTESIHNLQFIPFNLIPEKKLINILHRDPYAIRHFPKNVITYEMANIIANTSSLIRYAPKKLIDVD